MLDRVGCGFAFVFFPEFCVNVLPNIKKNNISVIVFVSVHILSIKYHKKWCEHVLWRLARLDIIVLFNTNHLLFRQWCCWCNAFYLMAYLLDAIQISHDNRGEGLRASSIHKKQICFHNAINGLFSVLHCISIAALCSQAQHSEMPLSFGLHNSLPIRAYLIQTIYHERIEIQHFVYSDFENWFIIFANAQRKYEQKKT